MKMLCTSICLTLLAVLFLIGALGLRDAGAETPPLPVAKVIFTMDSCAPCKRVLSRLRDEGVQSVVKRIKTPPEGLSGFPTVVYSLDSPSGVSVLSDNGERVLRGECRYDSEPMTVLHYSID